jgi:ferredoxin
MADKSQAFPDNVPGKYYVDDTCIVCGACEAAAPDNFKLSDDGSHDVVFQQPENEADEAACREAMEGCPVGAIGDDGEA